MKTILLLRHAKSDWSVDVCDYDRPLKKRGKQSAEKIGNWLVGQHLFPDYILSSPAKRASQTIKRVVEQAEMDLELICYQEKIYLAELPDLLKTLANIPDQAERVLLVGHNPGMDELLEYLAGPVRDRTEDGKLLTTAALAQLNMPETWGNLRPNCARLELLVRP